MSGPLFATAVEISPPASLALGAETSPTDIFWFTEQYNTTLASNLQVNTTTQGTYQNVLAPCYCLPPAPAIYISADTAVSSFFIHAEPDNYPTPLGAPIEYKATIVFPTTIIGLVLQDDLLNSSDFLGAPGTVYPTGQLARGVDFYYPGAPGSPGSSPYDSVSWINDNTLQLDFWTQNYMDEIRVIGEPYPEPATWLLLGSALAAIAFWRRRRVPTA